LKKNIVLPQLTQNKENLFSIFIDCSANENKVGITNIEGNGSSSFDLKIEFSEPIIQFRNHNYTWVDVSQNRIANDFSPKIIQLQSGKFVQANQNAGIWEVDATAPHILWWRFNPPWSSPITQYRNELNTKRIVSANTNWSQRTYLALLFTTNAPIELSRSAIPFVAIACFTDHCDFDTSANLKIQRAFLKQNQIKITKGFFLHHFSKRADNASWQNDQIELEKWSKDGHELCYHSLTQSIREDQDAIEEFFDFTPPLNSISVWIDHGFQPYNLSMFEKNGISSVDFEENLQKKNIQLLWNYVDVATATKGVLNQLNRDQFNLQQYHQSIQNFPLIKRWTSLIKNIIFHYDNDEFRVRNYIETITHTKNIFKKGKLHELFLLVKNATPVFGMILRVLLTWNSSKTKTYKVANYAPLFFRHTIAEKEFYVFQAIEMVDFSLALCPQNIDSLIKESGVFIAHTYLSVPNNQYHGKLIQPDGNLTEAVVENFNYLAEQIQQNNIWNPTVTELLRQYQEYQKILFDIDEKGVIFIQNKTKIPSRTVS
jgi:hypothetical protein